MTPTPKENKSEEELEAENIMIQLMATPSRTEHEQMESVKRKASQNMKEKNLPDQDNNIIQRAIGDLE
jgi:hypothetical protein